MTNEFGAVPSLATVNPSGSFWRVLFAGYLVGSYNRSDEAHALAEKINNEMAAYADAVVCRAVARLTHPEALGLAADATPPGAIDAGCLRVLADWLRDRSHDGLADEVARYVPAPGTVIVLRPRHPLSHDQTDRLRMSFEFYFGNLVRAVILPHGLDLVGLFQAPRPTGVSADE